MTESELMAIFGKRVRLNRLALGLSLSELARDCEINKSNICRYESGKQLPAIKTLLLMANRLDLNPFELLMPWDNQAHSETS